MLNTNRNIKAGMSCLKILFGSAVKPQTSEERFPLVIHFLLFIYWCLPSIKFILFGKIDHHFHHQTKLRGVFLSSKEEEKKKKLHFFSQLSKESFFFFWSDLYLPSWVIPGTFSVSTIYNLFCSFVINDKLIWKVTNSTLQLNFSAIIHYDSLNPI